MKVTVILKGMVDQNGQQPVQIRIAHGKNRTFKPTHIKINPEQFKKGKIISHPKADEWNQKIKNLIIQYQAQALNGFEKKTPKVKLLDYVASKIKHLDRAKDTKRQYQVQINKLTDFDADINLDEIDHDYFDRLKEFLKGLGNDNNTRWNTYKFLKFFLRKAVNDGLIKKNPFINYEAPKYQNPERTFLTNKEIAAIEKFIKKKNPPLIKEAAIWYMIGCYSGLRISDIKAFSKKKNIIGGRLIVYTQKTKEPIGLPVSGKLKYYLELANYEPLSVHENTYNKLLKVIAAACGIDKNLHAHVSRHTAAMMLANSGVSMEVTAKILGQKKLTTTAIYYKISNKRIDQELKKLK